MNCENSIFIRAPLQKVYATVANLENWPKLLPHYRWVRKVGSANDGEGGAPARPNPPVGRGAGRPSPVIVQMAARRSGLPIRWTSRFEACEGELRFHHLKAFTRGMDVKWTFTETDDGVVVRITHRLDRWYAGWLARYFIQPVASRTLAEFKRHLESGDGSALDADNEATAGRGGPK